MQNAVGHPGGQGPPQAPANGSLWAFVSGAWGGQSLSSLLLGAALSVASLTSTGIIESAITGSSLSNFTVNAVTAGTQCGIAFQDGGVSKWCLRKETTNNLGIYDFVNSIDQILITPGSGINGTVTVAGSLTVAGAQAIINGAATVTLAMNPTGTVGYWFQCTSAGFAFRDSQNTWLPFQYTPGSISVGSILFEGTLASTTPATGAVVVTGGLGAGGNSNFGGTLNVTGLITASVGMVISASGLLCAGGVTNTTGPIMCALTGNAVNHFVARAVTAGTQCGYEWQDSTAAKWALYKESTNVLNFYDVVNGVFPITLNPGAVSAGTFVCNLTTASSSTSTGAFQCKGGGAFAGALYVGATINGGSTLYISGTAEVIGLAGFGTPPGTQAVSIGGTAGSNRLIAFQSSGNDLYYIGVGTDNNIRVEAASTNSVILNTSGTDWLIVSSAGVCTLGGTAAPSANTFAGNVIWGGNTGSAQTAGAVGEVIQGIAGGLIIAAATGTYLTLTSINLTAGRWLISAVAYMTYNSAVVTAMNVCISSASASNSGCIAGYDMTECDFPSTPFSFSMGIPGKLISISASGTYYLNVLLNYTGSPPYPHLLGSITAIRLP